MASSNWASLATICCDRSSGQASEPWPCLQLGVPGYRVFPYVFIRENSDYCAARVSEVRELTNFAQVYNLPKEAILSPGLTKKCEIYILPATLVVRYAGYMLCRRERVVDFLALQCHTVACRAVASTSQRSI